MNESTRAMWNDYSNNYFANTADYERDLAVIKADPSKAFPRDVWAMLQAAIPDWKGKRVLVPSSGSNQIAFGFHLLGASLTSTDIAENQLRNAAKYAGANGWQIDFRQADSMTLDGIEDEAYDLVFTSNGVHVWISDLEMMYRAFHRVLKPGGSFVFFDTHPFNRPFNGKGGKLRLKKPYTKTGPFNDPPEYAWRTEDILRSLLAAGFRIEDYRDMQSYPDEIMAFAWHYSSYQEREKDKLAKYDWKRNEAAALPSWIGVSAKKA